MRLAGLEPATYRLGGGRSVQTELQAHHTSMFNLENDAPVLGAILEVIQEFHDDINLLRIIMAKAMWINPVKII